MTSTIARICLAVAACGGAWLADTIAPAPATAQIYIGPGGPVFGAPPPPYYGRPDYGGPRYREPDFGGGFGRISCGEGAQIVASEGFRRISPRECQGRVYRYTAFRGPASFEVRVSSSTGEITRVRRIN